LTDVKERGWRNMKRGDDEEKLNRERRHERWVQR
jgi:hypothetical protein